MTASLEGFSDQLSGCWVGQTFSRVARVPVADRAALQSFRKSATAMIAKAAGDFTVQTLDAVSDDHSHAIRVLVVTRLS